MQKELWRKNWLNCINELTSIDLQRKSWLDKTNSNPHWSFVEFICCYFDGLVIDNNYLTQLNDTWVSKSEFEIIKSWHELVDKYNAPMKDDYNVDAILEDNEWKMIVSTGLKAKFELSKLLSEDEQQILNEEIDYTQFK